MIDWISTHGIDTALICWGIACIISLAPKVKSPETLPYFLHWLYNIMQFAGASLDKIVLTRYKDYNLPALPEVVVESPKV